MPNKGKTLKLCPECKRNRFCIRVRLPYDYIKYTCSKGHEWKRELTNLEKAIEIELETILPKIKDAFERDGPFLSFLRKK